MGDHITICPEQLLTTPTVESSSAPSHIAIPMDEISAAMDANKKAKNSASNDQDKGKKPEEEDAGDKGECRFCQDEDYVTKLETPCHCNGTLKFAHRSCIQRWCNTKGSITCEICRQPYGPNYAVTERLSDNDDEREGWRIPGTNTQIHSPLALAEMATDRVAAALNDDCNFRNPSGGVLCGTGLLLFFIVLILRDAYYYTPPQKEDKLSNIVFCVLLLILAPFYILTWIFECRLVRNHDRERDRTE